MGGTTQILVVEDDEAAALPVDAALLALGHEVRRATSGAQAKALLDAEPCALVLLDLLLPDVDGLLLLAELRARYRVPVIICTRSRRRCDRVLGLKLGADDYVAKPCDVDELVARIAAVLRRRLDLRPASTTDDARPGDQLRCATSECAAGALVIDATHSRASLSGRELQLTPIEFRVLATLAGRMGEVVSRREITEAVWGCDDRSLSRSLDSHVRRLRAKLRGEAAPAIVSVRGFGYRLIDQATPAERASVNRSAPLSTAA